MHRGGFLGIGATALSLAVLATGVLAQSPAARPDLLFAEVWQQPPYTGELNDENRRATQDAITNPALELKLYGRSSRDVGVYNHEGRFDLWTGVVTSPVAIMLRDRSNYVDLTGLARLRAIVRTLALHVIHPVVRLADGTYLAGSRRIDTEGQFVQVEVAFGGMTWHRLNPDTVVTTVAVENPDLSKVEEVGFADLAPGGGHGIAGAFNVSTVELYANPIRR